MEREERCSKHRGFVAANKVLYEQVDKQYIGDMDNNVQPVKCPGPIHDITECSAGREKDVG